MRGPELALASGWVVIAEEPAALVAHGGVCEEGGRNRGFRLPLLGQDFGQLMGVPNLQASIRSNFGNTAVAARG